MTDTDLLRSALRDACTAAASEIARQLSYIDNPLDLHRDEIERIIVGHILPATEGSEPSLTTDEGSRGSSAGF